MLSPTTTLTVDSFLSLIFSLTMLFSPTTFVNTYLHLPFSDATTMSIRFWAISTLTTSMGMTWIMDSKNKYFMNLMLQMRAIFWSMNLLMSMVHKDNYQKLHIGLYGNDLPNYVQQWKDKYYIQYSLENRELYFPWATELVPQEILANQQESVLNYPGDAKHVCILGNIKGTNVSKIFADIKKFSRQNFLKFCVINNKSSKNRQKDLINCQIAPIISTQEQIDRNEIDYRLFQIISYGGFPVTNSKLSADLFDENCIYYANTGKNILIGGIDYKNQHFTDLWKWKVMEHVKKHHTFVQRVEVILWMLLRI